MDGLYAAGGTRILAKIAVELNRALQQRTLTGAAGSATARFVGRGEGWRVSDVICTSGPEQRPFEERHTGVTIAIVVAGTFQYRSSQYRPSARRDLMSPGSFLLGNPGDAFECAHDHGTGDCCISFHYTPDYFETVTGTRPRFHAQRLPPLRASAPIVARACTALGGAVDASWEELAIQVAVTTAKLANDVRPDGLEPSPSAMSRVTRIVRAMEHHPQAAALPLTRLAQDAKLSPYHFLRTFTRITGITPHQFALRARLREAALRLTFERTRVIDIALDCAFGDVSNFNRAFRGEFGVSPRAYRARG
jgi:AraC family transcriptional regulator